MTRLDAEDVVRREAKECAYVCGLEVLNIGWVEIGPNNDAPILAVHFGPTMSDTPWSFNVCVVGDHNQLDLAMTETELANLFRTRMRASMLGVYLVLERAEPAPQ